MKTHHDCLVYVETDDRGVLTPLSLEALNAAKQVVAADAGVSALVIGENVTRAVEELQFHNIDAIYFSEDEALRQYQPRRFLAIFEQIYRLTDPELTLLGNSRNSFDLSARASIRLNAALVTDCVKIESEDGAFMFTKPVYSNNVMAVYSSGCLPCMVTLRPKSTLPSERSENRRGEVIALPAIEAPIADEYDIVEQCMSKDGEKKLADADVIVSGGRGIGGPEGFLALEGLAARLDGKVGATRPPCDLGWIRPDAQVGITGAIVSPSVYFAIGISGSFQHMAGMSGSKTIIAINSDPKATIFKIADYGVIGEYEPVLSGLIHEIDRQTAG